MKKALIITLAILGSLTLPLFLKKSKSYALESDMQSLSLGETYYLNKGSKITFKSNMLSTFDNYKSQYYFRSGLNLVENDYLQNYACLLKLNAFGNETIELKYFNAQNILLNVHYLTLPNRAISYMSFTKVNTSPYSFSYSFADVNGTTTQMRQDTLSPTDYFYFELSFILDDYTCFKSNITSGSYYSNGITTEEIVKSAVLSNIANDSYEQGYRDGIAKSEDYSLKNLIFNILDAPFNIIRTALNFEIFGVNVSALVFFMLSIVLVGFVIKRLI